MKSKCGDGDYKLLSKDHYRVFEFNWDNINSFNDFKKATLLQLSKYMEVDGPGCAREIEFPKWVSRNPDFEKYFMMCY